MNTSVDLEAEAARNAREANDRDFRMRCADFIRQLATRVERGQADVDHIVVESLTGDVVVYKIEARSRVENRLRTDEGRAILRW